MTIPRTKIIYKPKGSAGEYAEYAANLFQGCGHGCTYCYVPGVLRMTRENFDHGATPRKNILFDLAKDCERLKPFARDIPPVLLSFTTDPYNPADAAMGPEASYTRQGIRMMKESGLSVNLLTKAGTVACRDFDLLTKGDAVAASLTLCDPTSSREWEPNAALPWDRIEMLKQAKRDGLYTWASLEPVIDPDQTLMLINEAAPYVDLFKVGRLNYISTAQPVNWLQFGLEAVRLMWDIGVKFLIKNDLRKEMKIPGTQLDLSKLTNHRTREQVEELALARHRKWYDSWKEAKNEETT